LMSWIHWRAMMNQNRKNYYDKKGCCLFCGNPYPGCWCDEVKCHDCQWYISFNPDEDKMGQCQAKFIEDDLCRKLDLSEFINKLEKECDFVSYIEEMLDKSSLFFDTVKRLCVFDLIKEEKPRG